MSEILRTSGDAPFAGLATPAGPHFGARRLAVREEFAAVDDDAIAASLDDVARPRCGLFAASPACNRTQSLTPNTAATAARASS